MMYVGDHMIGRYIIIQLTETSMSHRVQLDYGRGYMKIQKRSLPIPCPVLIIFLGAFCR